MPNDTWPDWEQVLSAAARLQRILPEAILVGGTAAALYAEHRLSTDADHVLSDLRQQFDQVLADLESVAGWKTARVRRPVQILGSLDGMETGVRQLDSGRAAGNHPDRALRSNAHRPDPGRDPANRGCADPQAKHDSPRLS